MLVEAFIGSWLVAVDAEDLSAVEEVLQDSEDVLELGVGLLAARAFVD